MARMTLGEWMKLLEDEGRDHEGGRGAAMNGYVIEDVWDCDANGVYDGKARLSFFWPGKFRVAGKHVLVDVEEGPFPSDEWWYEGTFLDKLIARRAALSGEAGE